VEAATVTAGRGRRRSKGLSESRLATLMMSPSLIVMALVAAYPIGYAIWLSLNEYSIRVPGLSRFAGLRNYSDALGSSEFWSAFKNTFVFTIFSVSIELVLGIAFAMAMHQAFRGRAVLRATVLVPWAVLTFGSGLLWRSLFEPNLGFFPSMLSALHLPGADVVWYGQDGYAMAVLVFADVWKTAPFMALLLLAGLPLLRPALLVALLFRTLDALRIFDLVYALTKGANGTTTLSYYAYQELTQNRVVGLGSALSVLTFVTVMAVSFLYIRFVGGNIRALAEES
jgi:multiple sugar transport system permease protein